MKKLILLALSLLTLGCEPSNARVKNSLEAFGFENIQLTGYEAFGCGKEDYTNTGFVATNTHGHQVSGIVCCGAFKNCTVRF